MARVLLCYPDTVNGMTQEEIAAMHKTARHVKKRPADLQWMLSIIGTIVPDHEYFQKGYVRPKKIVNEDETIQPGMISNS